MKPAVRENLKSLALGLAALAGLVLWLKYQPSPPADWTEKGAGEALCPGFTDAALTQAIRIVRPKPGAGGKAELSEIRLEKENGTWRIRTADDATADNTDRMASVLAPLLRLTVLSDIREINSQADENTVLEFYRSSKLLDPAGDYGADLADAGIRVTVSGAEGEKYADLIVGAVPEGSAEKRDIRYVRLAGEDAVFTADFSGEALDESGQEKAAAYADRLSTDPIDWMNRDLLRISRWNIARMTLYDAAADASGAVTPRQVLTAAQDPDRSLGRVWELTRQVVFDADGNPSEQEIGDENRFPDSAPLNERAEQIAHLRFDAFARLPAGLAEDEAAGVPPGRWTEYAEALGPLGFRFADHDPADPNSVEPMLLGAEGTAILTMKDGVRYTVLFGGETNLGQAILAIPSLDEETLAEPAPLEAAEGAGEEEVKRIADENRIRENQRELNRSRAEAALKECRGRLGGWVFFLGGKS